MYMYKPLFGSNPRHKNGTTHTCISNETIDVGFAMLGCQLIWYFC